MEIKTVKVGSLETNCYLLISDKELTVIDPGAEATGPWGSCLQLQPTGQFGRTPRREGLNPIICSNSGAIAETPAIPQELGPRLRAICAPLQRRA